MLSPSEIFILFPCTFISFELPKRIEISPLPAPSLSAAQTQAPVDDFNISSFALTFDSANSSEAEEDQGKETAGADLTDTNVVSEQDAIAKARIQSLEEENKKLKSALHRTLIERVVDTRIGLGFELSDDREKLIEEYSTRTASSLADSLRDLAKTPSKSGKRIGEMLNMPTIASEAEVSVKEENVLTIDMEDEPIKASDPKESFEQILVDALMGRRKL